MAVPLRSILILLFSVALTACNQNILIDSFQDLPQEGWKSENKIEAEFTIGSTDHYYQESVNLRIDGEYDYSNIILKLNTYLGDSLLSTEEVDLMLAEKSGKWLGSGLGDVISFQLPITNRKTFKQSGKYRVYIEQFMRDEPLLHVQSVGLKIEQQEEIF